MNRPIRIAISGAAGSIGYPLAFRIAAGGLFGADQPVSLRLLGGPLGLDPVEALRIELKDCAFPLLAGVKAGEDPDVVFEEADWIVLLGGARRTDAEQSRADLLRTNAPIFAAQGASISRVAPTARILVVATPCNTNCLVAMSHAMNVPPEHWFALNHLDRMRASALIAERAGVPIGEVSRVAAWGNHSRSVYIDFRNSLVGGRPAPEVIADPRWPLDVLDPTIASRTDEILRLRGGSPAGSAAQAILATIRAATTPTPLDRHFSACVASDGSYDVPRGLIFGFPLRTLDGKTWSIVEGLYHDHRALARLAANVAELEHEAAIVSDLLGSV